MSQTSNVFPSIPVNGHFLSVFAWQLLKLCILIRQIFFYSSIHAFPIHTNGFRGKTWLSDGVGKILLRTPSYGSKITGSHDRKEYGKSDKYWRGQKCCPMDSIDSHSSDGIRWGPSMSIGITRSVVVNLNSESVSWNHKIIDSLVQSPHILMIFCAVYARVHHSVTFISLRILSND